MSTRRQVISESRPQISDPDDDEMKLFMNEESDDAVLSTKTVPLLRSEVNIEVPFKISDQDEGVNRQLMSRCSDDAICRQYAGNSDASLTSSSEAICPSATEIPSWLRTLDTPAQPNESTASACPICPTIGSKPIPPWMTNPAAFMGYHYRSAP
ncbi:uncharacterized protein LOC108042877 isoform X1 [Drosophila rhopaloa]|uniref:Uncharacterized protein LOC108042877 isoform X1 n=1 Tax=Drosophila rhopaloa TaxID=1041015 RepID=A0A6P4EF68_DRORH|nr:uncharacterized protein LOC108042877 isoform X1 [Drosophila rhopaloa]XP_016976843.1 uncharacterized protein LOC108042877 isoform X1 [Drosophila rhopaloa]